MKRLLEVFILCILCIIFFRCSQPILSKDNLTVINKDTLEYNTIALSEILTDAEIIPLETSSQSLIVNISKLIFFNNLFFILDANTKSVLAFSSTGKFVRRYGTIGKGPGEFLTPTSICINKMDNTLLIYDMKARNILIFSIAGSFIKSIKIIDGLLGKDIAIKDNIIYLNTLPFSNTQYKESYNVRLFNLEGKYLGGLLKVSENNLGWIGDHLNIYCFSDYGDCLRYYNFISNHIYNLDQNIFDVLFTINSKDFFTKEDVKQLFSNKKGLDIHKKIDMLHGAKKETTFSKYLENNRYVIIYCFMDIIIFDKQTKNVKFGRIKDDITNTNNTFNLVSTINDDYCFGFANPGDIGRYNQKINKEEVSLQKVQLEIMDKVDIYSNPVIFKFKIK